MMERLEVVGVRLLYDAVVMASNTPEMIVMIRHILVSESGTVLRMMLIAAALTVAAPAACADVEMGAA
jgi:hypothetical protein